MLEGWSLRSLTLVVLAAIAMTLALGCSSSSSSQQQSQPKPDGGGVDAGPGPTLVQTDHGPVQGVVLDTSRRFTGIPFAAPPVGPLRWKPPADAAKWTSTFDASHLGPPCTGLSLTLVGPQPGSSE